ncbi:hypothetical protein BSKO_05966 [Bryopsis sp. KO-2023]|nr:hypothetical protein BSKO_05966 [Bryopsis sp. KO-2023]
MAAPQASGKAADSKSDFRVGGIRIEGASLAGMTTSVVVPQFKLAFDIGRCPQRSCYQQTVLISHGHLDHAGGVHFHAATRAMLDLPESIFIVPENLAEHTRNLLDTAAKMDEFEKPYQIKVLKVGDQLDLPGGFFVRSFPTVHPVPSQGYVVYSRKQTLKKKYHGLPGPEIRDLRKSGVEVTDTVEVAEIAFTGDTCADFLNMETSKEALKAKLLIMEMTFVDDSKDQDGAKENGHMHIDDLTDHQDKFKNDHILLMHFSPRYSKQQIVDALDDRLPESLQGKCVPLLEGFS